MDNTMKTKSLILVLAVTMAGMVLLAGGCKKEEPKTIADANTAEYLNYNIPDNAVEKKGPSTSKGKSMEYWVGDQHIANKTIYPNGNVAALVMYKDRKQHGPHNGWHENGAKSFESYFNEGVQSHFSRTWHDNGKLKTEVFFINGFHHGKLKQWNKKGELLGQCIFDMGTGIAIHWHDNGKLKYKAEFKNGKLHGMWEEWDQEGRVLPDAAKFYLEGKQVDKSEYLEISGPKVEGN
jgi:antitoxin component YwqK of YwqJK toxin-antitoxin module